MKKLLFIILLLTSGFMFAQKHQFSTLFPEKVSWTIQNKVLYAEYAHSDKGKFTKIVKQRLEVPTGVVIWTIEYPTVRTLYTIRVKGNYSVVTKTRT